MKSLTPRSFTNDDDDYNGYRILQPKYVQMINEALCSLGDYGEVRLVIERGRLRFLITQKSYDLLKWQPGVTIKDLEP